MKILVTGGAGYIGSHICIELLDAGYEVVVIDNLSNSSEESLKRVQEIQGKSLTFYKADLNDTHDLNAVFKKNKINAVIHLAGFKAVGESVANPLLYFYNNVAGSLNLFNQMKAHQVKNLVFSSSCTVYGNPEELPIKENSPLIPTNPYGRSKLMIEEILGDLYASDNQFNIAILRYFNPIGAHPSGRIGEDPHGIPNNLLPYISQVAVSKLSELSVFGNDYPTPDGTCIRDYIHVVDLAIGHIMALSKLEANPGLIVCNLGTGKGYSVLDIVAAFEKASGKKIPYKIVARRPGDAYSCYADPTLAGEELGWTARRGLDEMCKDTWHWQIKNPGGYKKI